MSLDIIKNAKYCNIILSDGQIINAKSIIAAVSFVENRDGSTDEEGGEGIIVGPWTPDRLLFARNMLVNQVYRQLSVYEEEFSLLENKSYRELVRKIDGELISVIMEKANSLGGEF